MSWSAVCVEGERVNRIPQWETGYDDGDTVEVQFSNDVSDCVQLDVSRVPCIVTLSKVSYA